VRLQELVDEPGDLVEGELRGRVRIEHGRAVDGVVAPRQRRFDREALHVDVRLDERRQMPRQRADRLGLDPAVRRHARHLDAAVRRQVVDERPAAGAVGDVRVERKRLPGLARGDDVGAVLDALRVVERRVALEVAAQLLPLRQGALGAVDVLVERDVEALDDLRPRAPDEPGDVLGDPPTPSVSAIVWRSPKRLGTSKSTTVPGR